VWYPYLDAITSSLTEKFSSLHLTARQLVALVSSIVDHYNWKDCLICSSVLVVCLQSSVCNRNSKRVRTMETHLPSNVSGEKTPVATPCSGCCVNAVGKRSYLAADILHFASNDVHRRTLFQRCEIAETVLEEQHD